MDIKAILNSEKGRTAQAQRIFAAKAAEMKITAFTKEECKTLRSWFKSEVINFDGFFATKAGNDALCHGLKNLQKGVKAKGVQDAQVDKQYIDTPKVKKDAKGNQQAKGEHDADFDDAQQQGQDDAQQQGQDDAQQQGQDDAQQQQGQDDAQQQGQDDAQQQGQDDAQQQGQDDAQQQGQDDAQQQGQDDAQQQGQDDAQQQQGQDDAQQQGQDEEDKNTQKITYDDLTESEKEAYWLMKEGKIPYLWGPAGTGKTTAAQRIAAASGQKFYFTSSVFDKYDLTGFVDAQGELIDTPLIRAILNGGDYLFDEWDVSDNQSVKFFNMLLSQRMFVIPKYGVVKCHPKFRVIAAGNTKGTGPTANYPTAVIQDASCRNRFVSIYYGYNEEIEMKLAKGDNALVSFVHDLRAAVKESGLDTVISYRNIINCKDMQDIPFYKGKDALIVKRCFSGDFDEDNFEMVSANLETNNKYTKLFKGLEIESI